MNDFLSRLERRFGRFAIPNLTLPLVALQAFVFVLAMTNPEILSRLWFKPDAIRAGEYWRLVTFLILPPSTDPIWILFALGFLYTVGTSLESKWGAFRYQVYWLLGYALTVGTAFFFHMPATNAFLLMSLFLAFATIWPDYEMNLLMVIPVKAKWLAAVDVILMISVVLSPGSTIGVSWAMFFAALGNYLLFFSLTLVRRTMAIFGAKPLAPARARAFEKKMAEDDPGERVRKCDLCGVTSEDPREEFRVCTCEKCGKPTEFCIRHAKNH